ncbi:Golgi SNAP receptor complex member 1-like isoform X1 [Lates japonicus]|uniref:Golgi SNAP receptor complex member 1 n=1 Tax=Lates japonicus TaxID=270547 RepID=A0AAD3QVN0_LATJO|nr:Golgi SNAP receptor complex member 1-like isoform X1 [Lates japonicus]
MHWINASVSNTSGINIGDNSGSVGSGNNIDIQVRYFILGCSDRLIDNAISIAMATKENITFQRGMLKSIQTRVTTLANRFPAINSLIQKINLRKRRDSLILGGVIGICTILLLLYTFH